MGRNDIEVRWDVQDNRGRVFCEKCNGCVFAQGNPTLGTCRVYAYPRVKPANVVKNGDCVFRKEE